VNTPLFRLLFLGSLATATLSVGAGGVLILWLWMIISMIAVKCSLRTASHEKDTYYDGYGQARNPQTGYEGDPQS
jgi:hypothetical protein